MKNIKIEESPIETVHHVLNVFSKLYDFFPDNHPLTQRLKNYHEGNNDDLILTEEDKKSTIDFIYKTVNNLMSKHLTDNIEQLKSHPIVSQGKLNQYGLKKLFNTEKDFLNNFSTLVLSITNENFIQHNDFNVIIDREKIIDRKLLTEVNNEIKLLFKKQLQALSNHTLFDTLIYQIDNKKDKHHILKNAGLDYLEMKNIVENKKELSEKYLNNVFKTLDFFEFDEISQIKVLDTMNEFFKEKYIKNNQTEIIDILNNKKETLLSYPNAIVNYHFENPEAKFENIKWENIFSYATENQLEDIIAVLIKTKSLDKDLELISKNREEEYFELLLDKDTILGTAFKYLSENRMPNGNLSTALSVFERNIYAFEEFGKIKDVFPVIEIKEEQNKEKSNKTIETKPQSLRI